MTQIVVQPGQSMWSIAASADPAADPRVVIQQIISANSLTGTSIRAGQLLWVPKPS
jgi:LysM repeat protein